MINFFHIIKNKINISCLQYKILFANMIFYCKNKTKLITRNIFDTFAKIIMDTYIVFFKNMFLYYNPIEFELVLSNNKLIKYHKNLNVSNNHILIKLHKITRNKFHFYNTGYLYVSFDLTKYENCVSFFKSKLFNFAISEPVFNISDLADDIEEIQIKLRKNNTNTTYNLIIKDGFLINHKNVLENKFIASILSHTTINTQFITLIYYYLQFVLNNFDEIKEIGIKYDLNDEYELINLNSKICEIFKI